MEQLLLILFLFFNPTLTFANSPSQEKVIEFFNKTDKTKPIANIKFNEDKDHILAVFEGTGLQKGKYSIIKLEKCVVGKKTKSKASVEILNFETKYGDISTEKKLQEAKISDLELDENELGLVKNERQNAIIINCGVLKP